MWKKVSSSFLNEPIVPNNSIWILLESITQKYKGVTLNLKPIALLSIQNVKRETFSDPYCRFTLLNDIALDIKYNLEKKPFSSFAYRWCSLNCTGLFPISCKLKFLCQLSIQ